MLKHFSLSDIAKVAVTVAVLGFLIAGACSLGNAIDNIATAKVAVQTLNGVK